MKNRRMMPLLPQSITSSGVVSFPAVPAICQRFSALGVISAPNISNASTPRIHNKNSHASPTPITDGKFLFVHFGTKGTACLTLDGEVLSDLNADGDWRICLAMSTGVGGKDVILEVRLQDDEAAALIASLQSLHAPPED